MEAEVKAGKLLVTIALETPRPSSTGKSLLVATTGGFTATTAQVDGKLIRVNLTAIVGT